jgi:hypothetical protein
VKQSKAKTKAKGERESSRLEQPRPQIITLAMLLTSIDAAADDEAINGIIDGLSSGKRAMLYSALLYTSTALGVEQTKANRLHALQTLRQLLF